MTTDTPVRVLSDGDDAGGPSGSGGGSQESDHATGGAQVGSVGANAPVRVLSEGDDSAEPTGNGSGSGTPGRRGFRGRRSVGLGRGARSRERAERRRSHRTVVRNRRRPVGGALRRCRAGRCPRPGRPGDAVGEVDHANTALELAGDDPAGTEARLGARLGEESPGSTAGSRFAWPVSPGRPRPSASPDREDRPGLRGRRRARGAGRWHRPPNGVQLAGGSPSPSGGGTLPAGLFQAGGLAADASTLPLTGLRARLLIGVGCVAAGERAGAPAPRLAAAGLGQPPRERAREVRALIFRTAGGPGRLSTVRRADPRGPEPVPPGAVPLVPHRGPGTGLT